jgi:hypothetical protein
MGSLRLVGEFSNIMGQCQLVVLLSGFDIAVSASGKWKHQIIECFPPNQVYRIYATFYPL